MRGRIEASHVHGHAVRASRSARLGAAFLFTLGLALAMAATPASAVSVGHVFDYTFGKQGTGAGEFRGPSRGYGIGIDQSTGDFYVADGGNYRVQKFDSQGNFILTWGYGVLDGSNELQVCYAPGPCQEGLAGASPGQMINPSWIAVDNSDGPNAGIVYVADAMNWNGGVGRQLILKYSPNGAYLGMIDASGTPGGAFKYLTPYGISIDAEGILWAIEDYRLSRPPYESRVMRFSNQASNAYVGGSEWDVEIPRSDGVLERRPAFSLAPTPSGESVYIYTLMPGSEEGIFETNAAGARWKILLKTGYQGLSGIQLLVNNSNGHVFVGTQEYDQDFNPVGPNFNEGKLCCGLQGFAINETTGTVYAFDSGGKRVLVYKPRRVAEATTEPASPVGHTTATLLGHTAPDPIEGGDVTECYFQWGLTTTYENVTPCEPGAPFSEPASVTVDLAGLEMENTYHFRLVAKNSIGLNPGKDMTFKPQAVLGLNTGEAANMTASTAILHGFFEPYEDPTTYYFEYGTHPENLNQSTPVEDGGAGSGVAQVSADIEGLEDHTHYYYRVVATNSLGTSEGPVEHFKTAAPDPPIIGAGTASAIAATGARLNATITPNFGETFYGFEYGESSGYGTKVLGTNLLPADDEGHQVQVEVGELIPGRTYHFRAIALNFGGVSYGPDATFTTADQPKVLTTSASSVTDTSARLDALVLPSLSPTAVRFEYGPSTSYGSSTAAKPIGVGTSAVSVSIPVSGLAVGSTHHFRAIATNAIGTATGPDQTFTTAGQEPPPPGPLTCKRGLVKHSGKCVRKPCRRGFARRGFRCVRKPKKRGKRRTAARQNRNVTAAIAAAPNRRSE